MTAARSDVQEFSDALLRLWEAAGKPPYSALVRLDDRESGVQTVSVQTLSDWFTGKSAPSRAKTPYVLALVRRLVTRASEGSADRGRLTTRRMEALLAKAQAESRRHRGGRPSGSASRSPAATGPDRMDRRYAAPSRRLAAAGLGVGHAGEPGDYFVGRTAALTALAAWMRGEHDRKARVVTGAPGAGKSALLGRLLALADPDTAAAGADPATVPPPGCVTVALDAHHTTLEAITGDLTEALTGRREARPDVLLGHLRDRAEPVTVLVDALDEAGPVGDSREAARIADELLQPLSAMRAVRLVVGTRRPFVDALGPAVTVLDLDEERWADPQDVAEYAERLLLDRADPDSRSPYRDRPGLARTASRAIAARAGSCFLVARMAARHLVEGQITIAPESPGWQDELPSNVGQAFAAYLRRFGDDEQRVRRVLTPLAYAQGPGLPEPLWAPLAEELSGRPCAHEELDRVRREHAGAYIHLTTTEKGPVFRLFHEALAEYLRGSRDDRAAHARIAQALRCRVPASVTGAPGSRDWSGADFYTRRYLAAHATAAGTLDDVLGDADYLVHADPRGLTPHLHHARTEPARQAAAVYRTSLHLHTTATPDVRRQVLALDATRAGATSLRQRLIRLVPEGDWVPRWATGADISPTLRHTLTVRSGRAEAVACTVLDGRPVAVAGGRGGAVHVWDLVTGTSVHPPLTGHTDRVQAVACTTLDGTPVAVTGGRDLTLRVWDLAAGRPLGRPLTGHRDWIQAVACVDWDGSPLAVTGGYDGTVLVWDLAAGTQIAPPLTGHTGRVHTVACTTLDGTPVAVTGADDMTVRAWNLTTGAPLGHPMQGKGEIVQAVSCAILDGRPVAVSCAGDTVQVWDLATSAPVGRPMKVDQYEVHAMACATLDDTPVAVVASADDGTVGVWDLATGTPLDRPVTGHTGRMHALACTMLDGRSVGVSSGSDLTVRVWDLGSTSSLGPSGTGSTGRVESIACTVLDGRHVAVTGDDHGTARAWDVATGRPVGAPLTGTFKGLGAVACTTLGGRPVLVTGGRERFTEGVIRVWDLATGAALGEPIAAHPFDVTELACTTLDGAPLVVSRQSHEVRVFDLLSGTPVGRRIARYTRSSERFDTLLAMACTDLGGRPVVVTGGHDGAVRVWDAASGTALGPPITAADGPVSAVACTVRGGRPVVVAGTREGVVRTWDLMTRSPVGEAMGTDAGGVRAVTCAVVDGTPLAAVMSEHERVHLWDVCSGERVGLVVAKGVRSLAITTGGHLVVGMGRDLAVFEIRSRTVAAQRLPTRTGSGHGSRSRRPRWG
ncbi:WD40 repeat domain-containing protein [Streptomyces sp. NPDC096079]|uniref:WD40 repeat domain-containing protein n=1 Tax=Streptomyces sp. NPDC096079 TaxID=3155820 RepID=UPI003317A574